MSMRHMKLLLEALPLLEATEVTSDTESNASWVEKRTPEPLRSVVPPKVSGTFVTQIPRGVQEFAYLAALREGRELLIQFADGDETQPARVLLMKVSRSDKFTADRTCTISFSGYDAG